MVVGPDDEGYEGEQEQVTEESHLDIPLAGNGFACTGGGSPDQSQTTSFTFYHIRPGTEGEGAPLSRLKAGCVALSRLMALFEGFDWLQNSRKPATGSDACGFGV